MQHSLSGNIWKIFQRRKEEEKGPSFQASGSEETLDFPENLYASIFSWTATEV